MSTTCDTLLSSDIIQNCTEPMVKGVEMTGVIINRADIDFSAITYDTDDTHIIKALPLKTGKKGYKVVQPSKNPFNDTQSSMEEGTYANTFSHELHLVILDSGYNVAQAVEDLANGEYVVVLENKHKNSKDATKPGNSAFQIYGLEQGMTASEMTSEKYSEDTNGGWAVTMTETGSPYAAQYLWTTSYAASKALFDSLTDVAE